MKPNTSRVLVTLHLFTLFALAFDARQPRHMYAAASGGEVFASADGGQSWAEHHLPEGATQVYSMACA